MTGLHRFPQVARALRIYQAVLIEHTHDLRYRVVLIARRGGINEIVGTFDSLAHAREMAEAEAAPKRLPVHECAQCRAEGGSRHG